MNYSQKLTALREERAESLDRMTALLDGAQRKGRDLNAAEQRQYDDHKAKASQLKSRIDRLEQLQSYGGVEVIGDSEDKREKGASFARCVLALAATKGNISAAAEYARRSLHDNLVSKALAAGSGSASGFTIPEEWTGEVFELLRPQAAVRALNPVLIPLSRGNATLGGIGSGATVGYIGENQNIPKTEPSFRQVRLSAKKLAALVPISNDLIRFSAPSADTLVRDEVIAAIRQAEDVTFIRSQGTEYTPKGLRYWAAAGNVLPMTATPTTETVEADLGSLVLALRNGNVRFLRPGWAFAQGRGSAFYGAGQKRKLALPFRNALGAIARLPVQIHNPNPDQLGRR